MDNFEFKRELLALPINTTSKIHLWLVYNVLKPSVSFVEPEENTKLLIKFLDKANLPYKIVNEDTYKIFCVAKDKSVALSLYTILNTSPLPFDAHTKLGRLYGFPKKAVYAYSANLKEIETQQFKKMVGVAEFHNSFGHWYWEPYVRYIVRRGYEKEDSLIAKSWADEIRLELPSLAKQCEDDMKSATFR
jgi:hypothetical protein